MHEISPQLRSHSNHSQSKASISPQGKCQLQPSPKPLDSWNDPTHAVYGYHSLHLKNPHSWHSIQCCPYERSKATDNWKAPYTIIGLLYSLQSLLTAINGWIKTRLETRLQLAVRTPLERQSSIFFFRKTAFDAPHHPADQAREACQISSLRSQKKITSLMPKASCVAFDVRQLLHSLRPKQEVPIYVNGAWMSKDQMSWKH